MAGHRQRGEGEVMSDDYSVLDGRPELSKTGRRVKVIGAALQGVLIALVALAVGVLVYNAYLGAQTRQELLDCTTPKGECYKESQERTGDVIAQLNEANERIAVLTAACTGEPAIMQETDLSDRIDLLEECMERRLSTSR